MQNLNTQSFVAEEKAAWSNKDNHAFYAAVKTEGLRALAEKSGLATGCDMQALIPYWSKAQSILEIGAGYGRAVDYLLKHQFQGKITAIERCNEQFRYLEERFNQHKNVHLLQEDIRNWNGAREHFDLIFLLWTSIGDFSLKEQAIIIKKLKGLLQEKGVLIIDTLPENSTPLGSKKCGQRIYSLEINNSTAYIHLSTLSEIKNHAQQAGFSSLTHKNYKTTNNRKRTFYILS